MTSATRTRSKLTAALAARRARFRALLTALAAIRKFVIEEQRGGTLPAPRSINLHSYVATVAELITIGDAYGETPYGRSEYGGPSQLSIRLDAGDITINWYVAVNTDLAGEATE